MYFFLKNSGGVKTFNIFFRNSDNFQESSRFPQFFKKNKKKKNKHYRIRINDVLPIAVIYFCTFPNFEALKCMILYLLYLESDFFFRSLPFGN